MSGVLYYLMLL